MITFPNAKINLGLHITGRREDGYHDLETIFYPLPFYDALEIIEDSKFTFYSTGIECGEPENNLCVKALRLIQQDFPSLPKVKMHLHKAIPAGAGLGGGSADGAFTLKLLNKKFALGLDEGQLREYALQLGSDCPFFITNKPSLATGRGEVLRPISLSLQGYYLLLVMPGIHISTKSIFEIAGLTRATLKVEEAILVTLENWKGVLKNDFEKIVFKSSPELETIKNSLYEMGAVYASMTGTGSSIYGIFKEKLSSPPQHSYPFRWIRL